MTIDFWRAVRGFGSLYTENLCHMKTYLLSTTCLLLLTSSTLIDRNDAPHQHTTISYKTEVNDCNLPTSQALLDVNNVRATLLDAGDLWNDVPTSSSGYEVPKGTLGGQNPKAIYAGAIWVSGLDAGSNLKIAALTYRQNGGSDFYAGPLDNSGNTIQATCNKWDRHFPVWSSQITPLLAAYQAALAGGGTPGSITLPISSISDSVKYWPGKGNPYLSALGFDVTAPFAPFYDADGDGLYDPAHGDYPTIRQGGIRAAAFSADCGAPDSVAMVQSSSYADQMIFWVFNDKGNVHNGSNGGQPIGLQVNALAFAFQSNDAFNDMTFYRYHLVNKSGAALNAARVSQFTDPDLGCPFNDRVGCDTSRNLAFVYNGVPANTVNTPGLNYVADMTGSPACTGGAIGYGTDLPVLGIQMLETPTDTLHRQVGMAGFVGINNASSPTGDPITDVQFRNYQTGRWKDGTPITWGGNGLQNSTTITPFLFPGDPADATQWSECNPQIGAAIPAYDRRILQTSGAFTFMPCASQYMTIAVTFTRPVNTNCPSLSTFTAMADTAQQVWAYAHHIAYTAVPDITDDIFQLFPNPVSAQLAIRSSAHIDEVRIYDLSGRLIQSQQGADIRSIDMAALAEGVYMVSVQSGSRIETQKIVKR